MKVSISFHGLVAFAKAGKRFDALLLPEKEAHKPVLSIPIKQILIDSGEKVWQPDMVGHDEGGNEIGMWDLAGVRLKIGTGTADPVWRNPNMGLALGLFHPGAKPKSEADLDRAVGKKGSKVSLTSGSAAFEPAPLVPAIVNKILSSGKVHIVTGEFSSAVCWRGDASNLLVAERDTGRLELELNEDVPSRLRITNVARVPAPTGLKHFDEYYQLVDLASNDGPLDLEPNEGDINVYDCVPPVPLPMV